MARPAAAVPLGGLAGAKALARSSEGLPYARDLAPITCEADGSRATARPKSAEGRDSGGDPPRQSSRARQHRRNRNRRASSTLRDRAALPRSANVRSPLKGFRWWGDNCLGSIAIQRLHEPSVFFSGLGRRHKAVLLVGLSFFWDNYTLVYRAI